MTETYQELKEKIRILEEENDMLSERAEEVLLISMITESLSTVNDNKAVIDLVLERISILVNIPFCAFGLRNGNQIKFKSSYCSTSNVQNVKGYINLSQDAARELGNGAMVLDQGELKSAGISIEIEEVELDLKTCAIIPRTMRYVDTVYFIFIDDGHINTSFHAKQLLLQRIIDITIAKIEILDLVNELQEFNDQLDRKVKTRTKEIEAASQALRASEEKFRDLFENSIDSVCILDNDGNFKEVNVAFEQLTGYTRNELLDMNVSNIVHPGDRQVSAQYFTKLKDQGSYTSYEGRIVTKNGDTRYIEVNSNIIKDEKGNIDGSRDFIRDITTRKNAESLRRQSEQRLKLMFKKSSDAIFLVAKVNGHILDANKAAAKLTGRSIKKLKTMTIHDVSPDGSRERIEKAFSSMSTVNFGEVLYDNPKGSARWALLSIIPLDDQTMFELARDITELKRSQEMMIQSEKMLSIGGLAAGMAHEINNPLAGMMQSANVIQSRLTNLEIRANQAAAEKAGTSIEAIHSFMADRDIIDMIDSIRISGSRASRIVKNMLSFAHQSESVFKPENIVELLDKTVEIAGNDYNLKKHFDFRKIKIVREYGENIPDIMCESGEIQQVFFNILRNGAEAMHSHSDPVREPSFILRVKFLPEDTESIQQDSVMIEIQDNGPGMDKKTADRIFEPFYTTKSESGGTGLGLSVSQYIIKDNHGGSIEVQSTKSEGTTFRLFIPVGDI